jgi:hypothetical protein
MNYSDYGLTLIDAAGSDLDKGIVSGGDGKFYQIDDFKDGHNPSGQDDDKGKVFKSSLKEDALKAGFDPTNFNTAGDVENALKAIGGGDSGSTTEEKLKGFMPEEDVEYSPEMQAAKERVQNFQKDNGGVVYGDGSRAAPGEVDYDNIRSFKAEVKPVK